ncbi:MAG TPA: hypothetical protein VGX76_10925, partial [Pirellulales bacterium]|nr:hypothetical protein [Pirellulales bacterium]
EVLATGGLETNLILWNARDLTVLKELKVDEWMISVRFSPDGRRLLSAGGSQAPGGAKMVQVWGLPSDEMGAK